MSSGNSETIRKLEHLESDHTNIKGVIDVRIVESEDQSGGVVIIGEYIFDSDDFVRLSNLVEHIFSS